MAQQPSPRIYLRHMRAAGYCASGARDFAKKHGLDWMDFIKNGIPAGMLLDLDDAMAAEVVRLAEEEANANG